MAHLFISWGREPHTEKLVQKLKGDLEKEGFSVWLDTADIPAGSQWTDEIAKGIKECSAFIAVLTKKYASSTYCKSEINFAWGKKEIMPLVCEEDWNDAGGKFSDGLQLIVNSPNWVYFRPVDDYQTSLSKLLSAMKAGKGA